MRTSPNIVILINLKKATLFLMQAILAFFLGLNALLSLGGHSHFQSLLQQLIGLLMLFSAAQLTVQVLMHKALKPRNFKCLIALVYGLGGIYGWLLPNDASHSQVICLLTGFYFCMLVIVALRNLMSIGSMQPKGLR